MKIKKLLIGMVIAGMTLGSANFSFAGRNHAYSDRGRCRVEKNYGKRWHKQDRNAYHRNGYRDRKRHYYKHRNKRQTVRRPARRDNSDPKVRVVVTPLGIFPVIW